MDFRHGLMLTTYNYNAKRSFRSQTVKCQNQDIPINIAANWHITFAIWAVHFLVYSMHFIQKTYTDIGNYWSCNLDPNFCNLYYVWKCRKLEINTIIIHFILTCTCKQCNMQI